MLLKMAYIDFIQGAGEIEEQDLVNLCAAVAYKSQLAFCHYEK